jgi:hypothetical protein
MCLPDNRSTRRKYRWACQKCRSSHSSGEETCPYLQCQHQQTKCQEVIMKNVGWVQSSALVAIGLACASVLMLTQNSTASVAQQRSAQVPVQVQKAEVTHLPTIVVTARRLSPAEKAKYQQMLKTAAATVI